MGHKNLAYCFLEKGQREENLMRMPPPAISVWPRPCKHFCGMKLELQSRRCKKRWRRLTANRRSCQEDQWPGTLYFEKRNAVFLVPLKEDSNPSIGTKMVFMNWRIPYRLLFRWNRYHHAKCDFPLDVVEDLQSSVMSFKLATGFSKKMCLELGQMKD